jgi:putative NADPH-quinone reductase
VNILVVLGHPRPGSFNHAIAQAAALALRGAGHEVILRDLYAEGFDPVLPAAEIARDADLPPDIRQHCDELAAADGLVIVHPNWWGQPPAVLKGWVDRVVRPGVAYEFLEGDGGEGVPAGLLKARAAVVFNTSNTPAAREQEAFGDPLERLWRDCILAFSGIPRVERRMFGVVCTSTPEQRTAWLDEARGLVREIFA